MRSTAVDAALAPLGAIEDRSRAFAEYWFSLPKRDLVPDRAHFMPEAIPTLLANMLIQEIITPDFIRMRLIGTAVEQYYGEPVTGRNYLNYVEADRRQTASLAIRLICEHPAGMLVVLRSASQLNRVKTRESIAFPVRNPDGVVNLAYFCSGDIREHHPIDREPDAMTVMAVMRRAYIDIGAGVPDFHD